MTLLLTDWEERKRGQTQNGPAWGSEVEGNSCWSIKASLDTDLVSILWRPVWSVILNDINKTPRLSAQVLDERSGHTQDAKTGVQESGGKAP